MEGLGQPPLKCGFFFFFFCEAQREVLELGKHSPACSLCGLSQPHHTRGVIHGSPWEAREGNELHVLLVVAGCL